MNEQFHFALDFLSAKHLSVSHMSHVNVMLALSVTTYDHGICIS